MEIKEVYYWLVTEDFHGFDTLPAKSSGIIVKGQLILITKYKPEIKRQWKKLKAPLAFTGPFSTLEGFVEFYRKYKIPVCIVYSEKSCRYPIDLTNSIVRLRPSTQENGESTSNFSVFPLEQVKLPS